MTEALWTRVSQRLLRWSRTAALFRCGQERSVRWIAETLKTSGLVLADEVGLGKTRVALLVMLATLEEGGRVVAVVPPGLLAQWRRELRDVCASLAAAGEPLQDWKPIVVRVYRELFAEAEQANAYPLSEAREGRFVLISQAFGLHRAKANARTWQIELPALVRAHREDRGGTRRNNRWWQYRETRRALGDPLFLRQDAAAQYLAGLSYDAPFNRLLELDDLRPHSDREDGWARATAAAIKLFRAGGEGRQLLAHLAGRLVGAVDLLVMDEAHRSRDEDDEGHTRKRFGQLVEEILVAGPDARRVSMTATPIELHPEQWQSLLRRTGIRESDARWVDIVAAIRRFSEALARAKQGPDEAETIEDLITAADDFQKNLSRVVTRRRRVHQREFADLIPEALRGAHPHRRMSTLAIEIPGLSDRWRAQALALEGKGIAAKGHSDYSAVVRLTDVRYASGQATPRLAAKAVDDDQPRDRKARRVRAWDRLTARLEADAEAQDASWLWTHPRVTQTAARIEALCAFDGAVAREKVLVFGRFSAPMHELRDALNARQVLRIVDLEAVAPVPRVSMERTLHEWREASRRGAFQGRLADTRDLTLQALDALVNQAKQRLLQRRESWRKDLETSADAWLSEALGRDREYLALAPHLAPVLSDEVFDRRVVHDDGHGTSAGEWVASAREIWAEHVDAILGHRDEDALGDQPPEADEEEEDGPPRLDPARVASYFAELAEEAKASELRGNFCRLLEGETKLDARRVLQARFNRPEVGPFVVIAQSLVGREGLNLHRACQRVVLFHPEWNPAIVEQQIGRVDRIESRWSERAEQWMREHGPSGPSENFPRIEVESVVFRGTYDEYNARVLAHRRASLNAQLFGALLDEESLAKVPPELHQRLTAAAPDWEPRDAAESGAGSSFDASR